MTVAESECAPNVLNSEHCETPVEETNSTEYSVVHVSKKANLLKNYIPLKIMSHDVHAMVDSGADVSIANASILVKYKNIQKSCKVYPTDKQCVLTANDERVDISGVIYVKAQIGKQTFPVKFYLVPNLHTNFILGLDFLEKHNVVVHFGSKEFSIDPRKPVFATQKYTIPPKSEAVVLSRIEGQSLPEGILGITSGSPFVHSMGLVSAKVLCPITDKTVYYRCANFSEEPEVIP